MTFREFSRGIALGFIGCALGRGFSVAVSMTVSRIAACPIIVLMSTSLLLKECERHRPTIGRDRVPTLPVASQPSGQFPLDLGPVSRQIGRFPPPVEVFPPLPRPLPDRSRPDHRRIAAVGIAIHVRILVSRSQPHRSHEDQPVTCRGHGFL